MKIHCEKCNKAITDDYYTMRLHLEGTRVYHGGNQESDDSSFDFDLCTEHYKEFLSKFYQFLQDNKIQV